MRYLTCCMLLAACFLSGCASSARTVRKHPMQPTADSAMLVGKSPLMYLSKTMNDVAFVEVDGAEVPSSFWTGMPVHVPVSPGKHTITLLLAGYGYVAAQEQIALECKPKHTYRFAARKVGIAFDVTVSEEAPGTKEGEGVEVLNTRIDGQRGQGDVYIPIFIPAR